MEPDIVVGVDAAHRASLDFHAGDADFRLIQHADRIDAGIPAVGRSRCLGVSRKTE